MSLRDNRQLASLIGRALAEDLGRAGDITSRALFDATKNSRAAIISKSAGILSGAQILKPLFYRLSRSLSVKVLLNNGARLAPGSRICELSGPVRAILAGERVALNFLQHLSGVATAANALARLISHTKAKLLDTRKTTPLLRVLEKEAVVNGNGLNHRFGLFDMVLIKDTHVKAAGGIGPALRKAQAFVKTSGRRMKIEVETQSVGEFTEALACRPHRIMLDNMSIADMAACVTLRDSSRPTIHDRKRGELGPLYPPARFFYLWRSPFQLSARPFTGSARKTGSRRRKALPPRRVSLERKKAWEKEGIGRRASGRRKGKRNFDRDVSGAGQTR